MSVRDVIRHSVFRISTLFVISSLLVATGFAQQSAPALPDAASAPAKEASAPANEQSDAAKAAPATSAAPEDYLITAEDLLNVFIIDVPELSREYRVSQTGSLSFPLLKQPLQAEGLTVSQFTSELATALRANGLVSDPHISVTVKESRLHSVAIGGAVKHPQMYTVFGKSSLLDILALAGGLEDDAGSTVRITRGAMATRMAAAQDGGSGAAKQESLTIDLKRLLDSGDSSLNVPIYPGDSVMVPLGGIVYVVGAVNRPGGFVLSAQRQGMTVIQVLALAEDVKSTAIRDKSMIVRTGPEFPGGRKEIPINLKAILAGKEPDYPLEANDVLYVPDSSSRKAFRRGAEAALQTLTGIAIYRR